MTGSSNHSMRPLSERAEIALAILRHPDCPKPDCSRILYGGQTCDPLMPLWEVLFPEIFEAAA